MVTNLVYLSTPIYYANGKPHFGHAYSSLYADFLANYYRQSGKRVVFVTGVDQHGQKIVQAAARANLPVETFVNQITQTFRKAWEELEINYDYFVETTALAHQKFVQTQFQTLLKNKNLKFQEYQGWYCISCETFVKTPLKNYRCFDCQKALKQTAEWNYFFRVTPRQKVLILRYFSLWSQQTKNPYFRDLTTFLALPNWDFSVSRANLKWAIPFQDHHHQAAYVWFDALFSYISVLPSSLQRKIWHRDAKAKIIHILGKEISKFHLVYWPLLLKATDHRLPDTFLLHGWLLNQAAKMSKSQHNAWDFIPIVARYGSAAFRLYIASLIFPKQDTALKPQGMATFYRSQLVNNLSNYCHRVWQLIKQQNWQLPKTFVSKHEVVAKQYFSKFQSAFARYEIGQAVQVLFQFVRLANQTFDHAQPWKQPLPSPTLDLTAFLTEALLFIANLAVFLAPFAPNLSKKINLWFNQTKPEFNWSLEKIKFWHFPNTTILFQNQP